MPTCSRALLILALLATATSLARSDGISNPGFLSDGFTGGISGKTGSGGGGGGCTPTGLIFNVACNSQYIPIIH